jgi:hypothetical protein
MEPTMTFGPGIYYVGDPGFVLPNNALRMLFANSLHHMLKSGVVPILEPHPLENGVLITSFYWMAVTPHLAGTFYDQDNTGWGFDWGCFGLVPWEIVACPASYENQKIQFTEPFECSFTEDSITIGHLHFTFNPK